MLTGLADPERAPELLRVRPGPGPRARRITLVKDLGETFVQGQGLLTTPQWNWGTRR